ncbi:MAG: type II toxin-antitoxin system RelB/DinJ family antitoxin [Deferribacteraceae bacterium]|jgi:DNA-damage-inducible protein J|nr:type II toxin-antitoxin system RelB/DinJ family antitoxin [Deferribacteraceae bacterium]
MARSANLHIRIDPETKAGAEELFSSFGITITDAVNIFLHQSLLEGGLPFQPRKLRYNAQTEAAIQEARDIMSGKIQSRIYESLDELNADIEKS